VVSCLYALAAQRLAGKLPVKPPSQKNVEAKENA